MTSHAVCVKITQQNILIIYVTNKMNMYIPNQNYCKVRFMKQNGYI
jgi:hypothetical protein